MPIDQVSLTGKINCTHTQGDVASAKEIFSESFSDNLPVGTAIDQADEIWSDSIALAAAAQTIDVQSLTTEGGRSVSFQKIKLFYVKNTSTTAADDVTVGNATNPVLLFGTAAHTVDVGPNGALLLWHPSLAGIPVTAATNDEIKFDPGANTITIEVIIAGIKT